VVTGVRQVTGALLLAISAVVLILAIGNLLSLPSVERQLVGAMPSAEAGVADVAAESRRKSYYGIAAGTVLGLTGAVLVLPARRGRAA
jgi:hypothetical protein